MFSTKQHVDRHVDQILMKLQNETERNIRSFAFAKLYFKVGDYEHAIRHINIYLSVKPRSAEAYQLKGKCLEKQGKKLAALEAYKTSLQLDSKQNNLVMKVCELLNEDEMDIDRNGAKYFCDLAQSIDPYHPVVFNLKEKLITDRDPQEVCKFLLKELEIRPTDVNVRVRLLKHFLETNQICEAYKHAFEIEQKRLSIFDDSLLWYETFAEVLVRYQRDATISTELTWEFWFLSTSVLEKLANLSLNDHKETVKAADCVKTVFNFDQSFLKASQSINDCPDHILLKKFFIHYEAQLNLHLSVLAMKQAKEELMDYNEVQEIILPLLFIAYNNGIVDCQGVWFNTLPESRRLMVAGWITEAAFRCSQAGNILVGLADGRPNALIQQGEKTVIGAWRERLFKKIFIKREHQLKSSTSYFYNSTTPPCFKYPESVTLLQYNESAQFVNPSSLHHYIWLALTYQNLAEFDLKTFEGLAYTLKNLNNCGSETLNVLDITSFIYCATICARSKSKNLNSSLSYFNQNRPPIMPVAITSYLGTMNQANFLKAAYKMYNNEFTSTMGDIRLVLINGIEVVRCAGSNRIDVQLLVKLAQIFEERAKRLSKPNEVDANNARAELYWKAALPLLEKLQNGHLVVYPKNQLFEFRGKDLSADAVSYYIEQAKLFMGLQFMKQDEYEKAILTFENLRDPYASYYQAEIFKLLADKKRDVPSSEVKTQNVVLLTKARDCYYLTLDRLKQASQDRDHPLNGQLGTDIERIERQLARVDQNGSKTEGFQETGSDSSEGDHYLSTMGHSAFHTGRDISLLRNDTLQIHSTPLRSTVKREARPSAERLDAQIRQLIAQKDTVLTNVLDQNRMMLEMQQHLTDEIRGFKEAVKGMTSATEQRVQNYNGGFDDVKKMVDDLSHSVDDRLQTITDMVQEMRRELNDIKKDQSKTNQINVEDLYDLEQDYSNLDYNLLMNQYPNAPAQPQPAQRLPQQPPAPNLAAAAAAYGGASLYPGLYPGLPYPYGAIPPQFVPPELAQHHMYSHLPPPPPPPPNHLVGPKESPKLFQSPAASLPLREGGYLGLAASAPIPTPVATVSSSRAPPVNVVITSSDPLPALKVTTSQPVLSVTIPPQHIKGVVPKSQPHNYQIPLSTPSTVTTPSILSQGIQPATSLGIQLEKVLDSKFSPEKSMNKSSGSFVEEYDPRPDFQPIIPLPDEVPVRTGEENETELFGRRGKLYRLAEVGEAKEWKERGVGTIKLLYNPETKKVRVVMRREQVHKICANHNLTKDMVLSPMAQSDRAFIWAAQDFADGETIAETFCVRFKTVEDANEFAEAFKKAQLKIDDVIKEKPAEIASTSLGGFKFKSTPTFKPQEVVAPKVPEEVKPAVVSPFAGFTFKPAPTATSKPPDAVNEAEEFVPTAEFQPVLEKLPELVEVNTGEETAEVLFQERCKLFRFDKSGTENGEWKERGLGDIKILKESNLRLVMRREQVHKVCLNHQILKDMPFKKNAGDPRAVIWHAKDFSEGVFKDEMFFARFKSEELSSKFLSTILSAQTSLDESNQPTSGKHHKAESPPKFDNKLKPSKGSWECKNCLIVNEGKVSQCIACETPKPGTTPRKVEQQFSFSVKPSDSTKGGFGDRFKPAVGSWSCSTCYLSNTANVTKCASCETPKDGSVASMTLKGISLDTGGQKFSFGVPPATTAAPKLPITTTAPITTTQSVGGLFDTVKTKEPEIKGVNLETGLKFNFGMPTTATEKPTKSTFSFESVDLSKSSSDKFIFGSPKKHDFEFKPRSPRKISTGHGEESDASCVEEEEPNVYFKPVIPLPDIVEVKTGEENEQVTYTHRARLYRFVEGEWKERGTGDVKILKDSINHKLRIVMRREQVFKICLNHCLTKDIDYLRKDEKSWLFHAADFSEGELKKDQFCLRFKNAEFAQQFKRAVDEALGNVVKIEKEEESTPIIEEIVDEDDDDDVIFVSETTVTADEEAEAERLMLPKKYMSYRQRPDCTCEQCKKDDIYFKNTVLSGTETDSTTSNSTVNTTAAFATPTAGTSSASLFASPAGPLFSFSTPSTSTAFNTPNTSSFVTPTSAQTSSAVIEPKKTESLKELLQKPSLVLSSPLEKSGSVTAGLFTDKPATSIFQTQPVFGSSSNLFSTPTTSANIFASKPNETKSLFGTTDSTHVFGAKPSDGSNVFGQKTLTNSVFGGSANLFSTPALQTNLFGTSSQGSFFGGGGSVIGGGAPIFGNKVTPKVTEANLSFGSQSTKLIDGGGDDDKEPVTFASLAKESEAEPQKSDNNISTTPFAHLGAGAPVFGGDAATPRPSKSQQKDVSDNDDDDNNAEHDPHFEPIIPLPDEIVVSTGEEEETALFNERAKLFRFDSSTKEWKERGIGQFKVLHHPTNKTYRLLLRREQVHKVVLNQRITAEFELQQMSTSDKAWMWAGYNYAENEGQLEKLAIRFKTTELAEQFKRVIEGVVKSASELPQQQTNTYFEDVSNDDDDEHYAEDGHGDDEDDDDDERSVMFTKRCTLSEEINGVWTPVCMGDLQIYYDSELYGARIVVVNDNGEAVTNTIIASNTEMTLGDKECTWVGVEWADLESVHWRTLKATFSSDAAAQEFHSTYLEGLSLAQEVGMVDEVPDQDWEATDQ